MAEPEPKFEDGLPEDYLIVIPSGYFEERNREMKLASLYMSFAKAALMIAGVSTIVSAFVALKTAFAVAANVVFLGGLGTAAAGLVGSAMLAKKWREYDTLVHAAKEYGVHGKYQLEVKDRRS